MRLNRKGNQRSNNPVIGGAFIYYFGTSIILEENFTYLSQSVVAYLKHMSENVFPKDQGSQKYMSLIYFGSW